MSNTSESRINCSQDSRLSSQEYLYSCEPQFRDWCNTLAHAMQIASIPCYSGEVIDEEDLGLLKTPFENDPPYDTPFLSVEPYASPGQASFTKAKLRAYKWALGDYMAQYQLRITENPLEARKDDGKSSHLYSPWPSGEYGLTAKIFDTLPGKWTKSAYNGLWYSFYELASTSMPPGKWTEIDRGAIVMAPLYSSSLSSLGDFDSDESIKFSYVSRTEHAYELISQFMQTLRADQQNWLGGCTLSEYLWGFIYHYGQQARLDPMMRSGIIPYLLGFIDFLYGTNWSIKTEIEAILNQLQPQIIDSKVAYPDFLSSSSAIALSSTFTPVVGAGVDSDAYLYVQGAYHPKSFTVSDFRSNPRMNWKNYVTLCDLYRSFCTTPDHKAHLRWAKQFNDWAIAHKVWSYTLSHHGTAMPTEVRVLGLDDGADIVVKYDTEIEEWESEDIVDSPNQLSVTREQSIAQNVEWGTTSFQLPAELNALSLFTGSTFDNIQINPDCDQDTVDWIWRLFPPDPEQKRQQDQDDLDQKYQKLIKEQQDKKTQLQKDLNDAYSDWDIELVEADVSENMLPTFQHFGYSPTTPPPEYPEGDPYAWFNEQIETVVDNDPTLDTPAKKEQRIQEMYQYYSDLVEIFWSASGKGTEIDAKWQETVDKILDDIDDCDKEIKRLQDEYAQKSREIQQKVYHPEIPSQEDQNRLLEYFKTKPGFISWSGGGGQVLTVNQVTVVAPLSGISDRRYFTNSLSTQTRFWPAPAIMMGPDKDQIYVSEWCPFKTMDYEGSLSSDGGELLQYPPELSDYEYEAWTGHTEGVGYSHMMDNVRKDNKFFEIASSKCPTYWTSPYGNFERWKGNIPELPDWPEPHEETVHVDFNVPQPTIAFIEDLEGNNPPKQRTVHVNGQKRSDLIVIVNGAAENLSYYAYQAKILSIPIGGYTPQFNPIPRDYLRLWQGDNIQHHVYFESKDALRCASFPLN